VGPITSFLVNPKVFKFNIQEWTDVALTGQFCSALSYILTQDISLATVFAANFFKFCKKQLLIIELNSKSLFIS
jgi:hypothetical protein